jgi:uncharacterized protein YkwD
MRFATIVLCVLAMGGCAPTLPRPTANDGDPSPRESPHPMSDAGHDPTLWTLDTRSPNPENVPSQTRELLSDCGEVDERLNTVAEWLARRGSVGSAGTDVDQLLFDLRAAGTPYLRPAAWSFSWDLPEDSDRLPLALDHWVRTLEPGTLRRCGLARHSERGRSVVVAVAAMALADLVLPLPTRARVGQWLDFRARLRVQASAAKVILLGPFGEPEAVPTQQTGQLVRARFAPKGPGPWLVQLLASVETGPCPLMEAMIFADVAPPSKPSEDVVPGELAPIADETPEVSLTRMVTAMRLQTGRPPMRRDVDLDRLARAHAEAMRSARHIGHDVGDGPTHERLAGANLEAHLAGENVAHAAGAVRVHRALWASPSHRSNLLHRGFARWGVGVARDEDGSLWVCELFASER